MADVKMKPRLAEDRSDVANHGVTGAWHLNELLAVENEDDYVHTQHQFDGAL